MKLFQYKTIFLMMCCTIDQQASQFRQLCDDDEADEKMHCAIRAVDLSFADRNMFVSDKLKLVDDAIMWRYQALGNDDAIDTAISEAKKLYEAEAKKLYEAEAMKRHAAAEAMKRHAAAQAMKQHAAEAMKWFIVEEGNSAVEVLVSQAIVAFLQGQAELGNKYILHARNIQLLHARKIQAKKLEMKLKKPETEPVGLGLIKLLIVDEL